MEYNFENLEKIKKEILNSNLSEETKKIVLISISEKYFNEIRTKKEIQDNIEFYHSK